MKLKEAIKIKEHNKHRGILCPTPEEFEADDLSIEAMKRIRDFHEDDELLPGETKD